MYRKRGFTLIELLVVIAIIAIMAAILFPVFAQARDKARQTTCLSNMKQTNLGLQMYVQDYDETWIFRVSGQAVGAGPTCNWFYVCDPRPNAPNVNWWVLVEPYTKNRQILGCPSSSTRASWQGFGFPNLGLGLNCYPDTSTTSGLVTGTLIRSPFGGGVYPGVAMAQVTFPAQTICMADAGKVANPTNPNRGLGDQSSPWIAPREVDDSGFERGPDDRHSAICNVAFLDGHVKAMKPQAFFYGWNGIWFRTDRMAVKPGDPNLPR